MNDTVIPRYHGCMVSIKRSRFKIILDIGLFFDVPFSCKAYKTGSIAAKHPGQPKGKNGIDLWVLFGVFFKLHQISAL